MKERIREIMDNQGLSLGIFCDNYNLQRHKIENIFYNNKIDLNESEIKIIKDLQSIKSSKVKYVNEKLIIGKGLNIKRIFPPKTKYNFDIHYKNLGKGYLEFWYQPKTRGKTSLILPSKINLDEKFFISLGLSTGDGLNNLGKRNIHYNFCNKNLDLVKYNYLWLKDVFKVKNIEFYLYVPLKYKDNIQEYKKHISSYFNIKSYKIKYYFSNRHKEPAITLQISNSLFQSFYLNLFPKLKSLILSNEIFRKSFLRGLFAAEGHVKHSIYGTIESISLAFNPFKEIELAKFVLELLRKEEIKAKINFKKDYIYFCGYENMIKFYLKGLIDLHKEKKEKFLKLCKNANICIEFYKFPVKELKNWVPKRKYLNCLNVLKLQSL